MASLPLFALLALLAAGPSASIPEPCALITRPEASAALEAAVEPGRSDKARGGNSCHWSTADNEKHLFVTIIQARDIQFARSYGGKLLPGIGDEAVWSAGSLFIRKGSTCVQVGLHVNANSMKAIDPELLTLGRSVAGRM